MHDPIDTAYFAMGTALTSAEPFNTSDKAAAAIKAISLFMLAMNNAIQGFESGASSYLSQVARTE